MSRSITIKDISKMAGVNPSTVSRALRDHPDISTKVKERIKGIAKEFNFTPNKIASNLRSNSSRTLALIIPEINMFFFPSVINGVTQEAARAGYHVMVLQCNEELEREEENIQMCINNRVSGIVISLSRETDQLDHIIKAIDFGIPVVFFDKAPPEGNFDTVKIDDERAAYNAVSRLKEQGCKHIAGLFGHPGMSISRQRLAGYTQAILTLKIESVGEAHCYSMEQAREATAQLVARGVDGIFSMSDEIISGILPALNFAGVSIPEQCRVVGISDGKLPFFFTEYIEFLHHDGHRAGQLSVLRLIELIEKPDSNTPRVHILDTPLMNNQHVAE